jgi:ribosome-binding ATPase YchF (GTP1/OBG family)
LKDLESVEKKISRSEKIARTDKDAAASLDILRALKQHLEQGKNARAFEVNEKDKEKHVDDLFLLTIKPVVYVCNVDEQSVINGNKYTDAVNEAIKNEQA